MDIKYHINYNFIKNPVCYKDTVLVQLGRLYCCPDTLIKKHAHINWYELTVVCEGSGIIRTNDVETNVSKGDIYLSFPGDFHEIHSSADQPLKYDFFSFDSKNPIIKNELKNITTEFHHYSKRIFRDEQINLTISNAIAEFASKEDYHDEILSLLLEQILYCTIRNFSAGTIVHRKKHAVSSDELCFQIMHYIDTHIYTIESLSVLSEKFNYNYSYLSNLFKKNTNRTIADYYQSRRLDAAKLLLNEGVLNVSRISEMLNYSSLYSFSKAFKAKYGTSPKNYFKSNT